MTVIVPLGRAGYRVRQFINALGASMRPLTPAERAEARAWLPQTAWSLFDAMPHNDQRHSLIVLNSLRIAGHCERGLMQAALLHDAAKSRGRITLLHRAAFVLLKMVRPGWLARLAQEPTPAHSSPRYPFWVHVNHPQMGAEMAAAAGCDPLAVTLIHRHQEPGRGAEEQRGKGDITLLLIALQTADDDN